MVCLFGSLSKWTLNPFRIDKTKKSSWPAKQNHLLWQSTSKQQPRPRFYQILSFFRRKSIISAFCDFLKRFQNKNKWPMLSVGCHHLDRRKSVFFLSLSQKWNYPVETNRALFWVHNGVFLRSGFLSPDTIINLQTLMLLMRLGRITHEGNFFLENYLVENEHVRNTLYFTRKCLWCT